MISQLSFFAPGIPKGQPRVRAFLLLTIIIVWLSEPYAARIANESHKRATDELL